MSNKCQRNYRGVRIFFSKLLVMLMVYSQPSSSTLCSAGYYSLTGTDSSGCTSCLAGQYQSTAGATSCASCLTGTSSISAATACYNLVGTTFGAFTLSSQTLSASTSSLTGTNSLTVSLSSSSITLTSSSTIYFNKANSGCNGCVTQLYLVVDDGSSVASCINSISTASYSISKSITVAAPGYYGIYTSFGWDYSCSTTKTSGGNLIGTFIVQCPSGYYGATSCSSCAAGYYSAAGASFCSSCLAGSYSSNSGASNCESCGPGSSSSVGASACTSIMNLCSTGTYSSSGYSTCSSCATGTYQSSTGSISCSACTGGSYCATTGLSAVTGVCSAGKYSLASSAVCSSCLVGTYVASSGSLSCGECPGGSYCAITGLSAVTGVCASGFFSTASSTVCSNCAVGYYSNSISQSSCTSCPSGYYQENTGASFCTSCSAGYYSADMAATTNSTCGNCLSGFYSLTSSSSCTMCEAGYFAQPVSDICLECYVGTYSQDAADLCIDCDPGQYSGNLASECTDCPAGKHSQPQAQATQARALRDVFGDDQGVTDDGDYSYRTGNGCLDCEVGQYSHIRWEFCEDCEKGTYASSGLAKCDACDAGTYSLAASEYCSACTAGTYSVDKAGHCIDCAPGMFNPESKQGKCMECGAGSYSSESATSCSVCPAGTHRGRRDIMAREANKHRSYSYSASFSYSYFAAIDCEGCEIGRYSEAGASHCTSCSAGTYSIVSSSSCANCAIGTFQALTGGSSCASCTAGSYCASTGLSTASFCPAGKFSLSGASNCTNCFIGTYQASSGTSACSSCSAGKFLNYTGAIASSSCIDCPGGYYNPFTAQPACFDCPAGFYCTFGSSINLACDPGSYSQESAWVCLACPSGTFSHMNSSLCSNCDPGQVSLIGATVCLSCPAGKYSQNSSLLSVRRKLLDAIDDDGASIDLFVGAESRELPSDTPTVLPSGTPTALPSMSPTALPSAPPTVLPSSISSNVPSMSPSHVPSTLTSMPTKWPKHVPFYSSKVDLTSEELMSYQHFNSFYIGSSSHILRFRTESYPSFSLSHPSFSHSASLSHSEFGYYSSHKPLPFSNIFADDFSITDDFSIQFSPSHASFSHSSLSHSEFGYYSSHKPLPFSNIFADDFSIIYFPSHPTFSHMASLSQSEFEYSSSQQQLLFSSSFADDFSSEYSSLYSSFSHSASLSQSELGYSSAHQPQSFSNIFADDFAKSFLFFSFSHGLSWNGGSSWSNQPTSFSYSSLMEGQPTNYPTLQPPHSLSSSFSFSYNAIDLCSDCEVGQYSKTKSEVCTNCTMGRYAALTATPNCTDCAAGTYQGEAGRSLCYACEPGTYSAREASNCTFCSTGKVSDFSSSSCISFPTPSPSISSLPTVSPAPSVTPTATSLTVISVSFSMEASDTSSGSSDILMTTISDQIGIRTTSIKNFKIDDGTTSITTRTLLSYTWSVSFDIHVDTSTTSAENLVATLVEVVTSPFFSTALASGLGFDVTVDTLSLAITASTRRPSHAPSPLPSRPSQAPTNAPTMMPATSTPSFSPIPVPSHLPSGAPTIYNELRCVDQVGFCGDVKDYCDDFFCADCQLAGLCDFSCFICRGEHPTYAPSTSPVPTATPSKLPTPQPTRIPSPAPTFKPSYVPTAPTNVPTRRPTFQPTQRPTPQPTPQPTARPSNQPTSRPTFHPSNSPSRGPTPRPSTQPSLFPTRRPTHLPSPQPTSRPTSMPTNRPTHSPSQKPSPRPTSHPTQKPTRRPTGTPTHSPTGHCTPGVSSTFKVTLTSASSSLGWDGLSYALTDLNTPNVPQFSGTLSNSNRRVMYVCLEDGVFQFLVSGQRSSTFKIGWSITRGDKEILGSSSVLSATFSVSSGSFENIPTAAPTLTQMPTPKPSSFPSLRPSFSPSFSPSLYPSAVPTPVPTHRPTVKPSFMPTHLPTISPSFKPSQTPTPRPTHSPTLPPSSVPTSAPTSVPTVHCNAGYYLTIKSKSPICEPCAPGYFSNTSSVPFATECHFCGSGKAAPGYGNYVCLVCVDHPQTKYDKLLGFNVTLKTFSNPLRTICGPCQKGEFTTDTGCEHCVTGRYAPSAVTLPVNTTNASQACYSVPEGFRASKDTQKIQLNMTGATAIVACTAGYYSKGNTVECKICSAGKYSKSRASYCLPCLVGYYQSESGKPECTDCDAGKHAPFEGSEQCIDCPKGTNSIARAVLCTNCTAGRYASAVGSLLCKKCGLGTVQPFAGLTFCVNCLPGYFMRASGGTECRDCLPGTYMDDNGASFCRLCASGQHQRNMTSTSCLDCIQGNYQISQNGQSAPGQIKCEKCEAGKYQANDGQAACDECVTGYSSYPGSPLCRICAVNYWYKSYYYLGQNAANNASFPQASCEMCPANSNCGGELCLPIPKTGYWSQGVDRSTTNPDDLGILYRCPTKDCDGISNITVGCDYEWSILSFADPFARRLKSLSSSSSVANADTPLKNITIKGCKQGSIGPFCAACKPFFYLAKKTVTCTLCGTSMYLMAFGALLVLIILRKLYNSGGVIKAPKLLRRKLGLKFQVTVPVWKEVTEMMDSMHSGHAKVVYGTLQILDSVGSSAQFETPEPLGSLLSKLSGALSFEFLNTSCVPSNTFHDTVYQNSAFPVLVVIYLYSQLSVSSVLRKYKFKGESKEDYDAWYKKASDSAFSTSLAVVYIFLPDTALSQFQGLSCTAYSGSVKEQFLTVDSLIDCSLAVHKNFVKIDAILILAYQLLTAGYLYLLYSNRERLNPIDKAEGDVEEAHALRDSDVSISHINFLFSDIRCGAWFHEVLDMVRRIFFIGVIPLLSRDPVVRCYIGSLAAVLSTIYFRELLPYRDKITNCMAVIGQYQILAAYIAFLIITSNYHDKLGVTEYGIGTMLTAFTLILPAFAYYVGVSGYVNDMLSSRDTVIQDGTNMTKEDFERAFSSIELEDSHVLVYHYTTLEAAQTMLKLGIPAFAVNSSTDSNSANETCGFIFSFKGPHELEEGDPALKLMSPLSSARECVICLALPRTLLWKLEKRPTFTNSNDSEVKGTEADLVVLPISVVKAMRRMADPKEDSNLAEDWPGGLQLLKQFKKYVKRTGSMESASPPCVVFPNNIMSVYMLGHSSDHGAPLLDISQLIYLSPLPFDSLSSSNDEDFSNKIKSQLSRGSKVKKNSSFPHPMSLDRSSFIKSDKGASFDDDSSGPSKKSLESMDHLSSSEDITQDEREQRVRRVFVEKPSDELWFDSNEFESSSKHLDLNEFAECWFDFNDVEPRTSQLNLFDLKKEKELAECWFDFNDVEPRTSQLNLLTLKEEVVADVDVFYSKTSFFTVQSCADFLKRMTIVRSNCDEFGLVPLYYYTTPFLASYILSGGFRIHSESERAGVSFTTQGPASFGLGSLSYEKNLIISYKGASQVNDYIGKHKLDACIVYGVDPRLLQQDPGNNDHFKMIPKMFFDSFADLAEDSENYMLRSDRVMDVFIINPFDIEIEPISKETNAEKCRDELVSEKLEMMETILSKNDAHSRGTHVDEGAPSSWLDLELGRLGTATYQEDYAMALESRSQTQE